MIDTFGPCQITGCKKFAVDSLDFEAGDGAEFPVSVNLCDDHMKEEETLGYKFQEKYGARIDQLAYERLVDQADYINDMLEDR
jgi:hypothetical protein